MTDQEADSDYQSPSVERWGTVLDLTSAGDVGGSGDTFQDNSASINCPAASDNGNGNGNGCGG